MVYIKIYLQSIEQTEHNNDGMVLPGCRWGGVINQDIVLINAVEEIQRNLNAFVILAENKRVDIAIADNPLKFVQIFCLIFSNIFCLINLI